MTDAEILAMANEAGLTEPCFKDWCIDYGYAEDEIKRFAALVAVKEREACATLCEEREDYRGEHEAAIRARGKP